MNATAKSSAFVANTMLYIPGNPFSERALLALDVAGIKVKDFHSYSPSEEKALRVRTNHPDNEAFYTPMLSITDANGKETWIKGGLEITRWAATTTGKLPVGNEQLLARIDELVSTFMSAGRVRTFTRAIEAEAWDPQAFGTGPARFLPAFVKGKLFKGVLISARGKYSEKDQMSFNDAGVRMRESLLEIERLRGGKEYFDKDSLSVIDTWLAGSLGWLSDCPAERSAHQGSFKLCFYEEELGKEFKGIIEWRDATYAKHSNGKLPQA